MKIIIVDQYYKGFLDHYYATNKDLAVRAYSEQKAELLSACFGTADFYSRHLCTLGHESVDLIANCVPLQKQWAREHGIAFGEITTRLSPRWRQIPFLGNWLFSSTGLLSILLEQIKRERPDILYMQDLNVIPPKVLYDLKVDVKLLVGQIACPLPAWEYLKPYDLILTSFPHYVSKFREQGIASEYFRIAFDPVVRERIGKQAKRYGCTFVGGISAVHPERKELLEYLAQHVDIQFFGYGLDSLDLSSPIRPRHCGEAWALDMYRTLAQSYITVNCHIDVAENYANNMRLFEATGCGAMLITDAKDNLNELFEVGREIVSYRDPREAVERIEYYASHPEERDAIAYAGQQRTLQEHTYRQRMEELVEILRDNLR